MVHQARTPGARIGAYELVEPLGRGGMGEVWHALLHGPAGFLKPVALKCLVPERLQDPGTVKALLREARLGARLQHPNIVGTLGVAEEDGTWVVALELVRGASLSELMRAVGGLPPAALLDVGVQTAAGLAHAHRLGLVHRDVKPANLLVDRSGLIKITDLGISMLAGEQGGAAGTPGYMPPEQARGFAEARSDLFALGVTLLRLATGRRPLGSGQDGLRGARRIEEQLADPEFLAPADAAVPGLGEVLYRCLRLAPADRWGSATELGDALKSLQLRQPVGGPTLLSLLAQARPGLEVEPSQSGSAAPTQLLPTGNVPAARDPFVGRVDELRVLRALVLERQCALVVVQGPGGMGKTRLALEAARRVRTELPGGAWSVDLSEARTVHGVCAAVARGLGVSLGGSEPVDQLGRVMAEMGRVLLVFDNLEQCVEHLPDTLGAWLGVATEASFLCTSRVRLRLRGEHTVSLGPLPAADAEALFRARSPRPLAEDEEPVVALLCAALEGHPLAIELAAARVGLLGVRRVHERLSLALLSGNDRDRPERHRSLVASLDWSVDLLSPPAVDALYQLAVFESGFELEAAEGVLELAGDADVLSALEELVDASLLRVDVVQGRFSLLVLVREYCEGRTSSRARRAAEVRHGAWFAQLGVNERIRMLHGPRGAELRRGLLREVGNLRIACRRAVTRGDATIAVQTLAAMWPVTEQRGPFLETAALAERVVGLAGATGTERAAALGVAGYAQLLSGDAQAGQERLEAALALWRRHGPRRAEGTVLNNLGNLHRRRGRLEEARLHYEAALEVYRETGDGAAEGKALTNLATIASDQGRLEEARTLTERALVLNRVRGSRVAEAVTLGNLGNLLARVGRSAEARVRLEAALAVHREQQDQAYECVVLLNLAVLEREGQRLELARSWLDAAAELVERIGSRRLHGIVWGEIGTVARLQGDLAEARDRFEAAATSLRAVGDRLHLGHVLGQLAVVRVYDDPDAALALLTESEGLLENGDPSFVAEHLGARAQVLGHLGDRAGALEALELAVAALPSSERMVRGALERLRVSLDAH